MDPGLLTFLKDGIVVADCYYGGLFWCSWSLWLFIFLYDKIQGGFYFSNKYSLAINNFEGGMIPYYYRLVYTIPSVELF